MRKKILEQKIQRLLAKKAKFNERCTASTDVNEVRGLTEQLEDVNAEIEEAQAELDEIKAEEARAAAQAAQPETRASVPAAAELHNGTVVASFETVQPETQKRAENVLESMEYRNAFMAYVQKGTEIPAEFRNGAAINTADTGAAIPLTIMNEVINTVRKRYGNLYAKVRKMSVAGGVEFPIGALQASFKWIKEDTVSPRQDIGSLGKISFSYHMAEIRISQTFLSQLLSLSDFEAKITEVIAIAYLEAMDYGIVKGSGNGTMLGILNDPRVTNKVKMTTADFDDWTKWRTKFFKTLPLGYRGGEFIFPVSTVDAHLETMHDNNNNPIFRQATGLEVFDGDSMNPSGRFFGREVALVESNILPDFDTASENDVVGIYWQPDEYAINENFGFTMRRYFDEETNEWVDKAIVVVDGKVLNPNGYVLITKGAN